MIQIQNVSKTYGNSNKKAVDNLTLTVNDGEIFGFLGPNGAGKSTTIKMISGILSIDEGAISIDGIDIAQYPMEAKKHIGFVPDTHETYENLTANEFLNFIGTVYDVPSKEIKQRAEKLLSIFELDKVLNNPIKTYSHGMKQKILVVAALLHNPKVWILDEPLTGLDPQSAYQLKLMMRNHADEGNTVFFSSHVIDVVEKVCDRIAIIDNGSLVVVDTLDNIRQNKDVSLEDVFLKVTGANVEDYNG